MIRGIQRHDRLQRSCGKQIRTVKDFRNSLAMFRVLYSELAELFGGVDPDTRVYVFKEVSVDRVKQQSRRADLVFYVPRVGVVYVEYKTVESASDKSHDTQLRETHNNLVRNLSYKLSYIRPEDKTESMPLEVTTMLFTKHFGGVNHKMDSVYKYPEVAHVCDTIKAGIMVSILGGMGRLMGKE